VVGHLPSNHKDLSSNPSTTKKLMAFTGIEGALELVTELGVPFSHSPVLFKLCARYVWNVEKQLITRL
jgi:hypothetical protein